MKIRVQSIHFDADRKLLAFIQKKANKLDQFFDQIISGDVYLKLDKNKQDEANKVSEIKLAVPGGQFFAKEQCRSFEAATDLAIESIRRQVSRHKEKVRTHVSHFKQAIEPDLLT